MANKYPCDTMILMTVGQYVRVSIYYKHRCRMSLSDEIL